MTASLLAAAAALDEEDPLAAFASQFHKPQGVTYLDGNSLGLMPHAAHARLSHVAREEWSNGLIRSWSQAGWLHLPTTVGDRIAPLIGAGPGQIAVGDSTSVNLFKALSIALHHAAPRRTLVLQRGNFPTDNYIAQGLQQTHPDLTIRYIDTRGTNNSDQLSAQSFDDDVAVVLLSHVDYRTAHVVDMAAINACAHRAGALVVWDLSHSTGAVPVDLVASGADLAVGCTYKYLNGGPGAPAFIWVNPALLNDAASPMTGWMGHQDPFAFASSYAPAQGIRRLVVGTPQILSLATLDESLKLWADLNLDQLFAKSRRLTEFFISAVEDCCADFDLILISPRDESTRGSHVSFDLSYGGAVMRALSEKGFIGDFRAPETMRFGFAPLYNNFAEAANTALALADLLQTRGWDQPEFLVRAEVT